ERVEGQIALRTDRDVTTVQRRARVRVLVQTERDDPGARHEQEHREARLGREVRPHRPAGHRRDRGDAEEDGADPVVAATCGGGGHGVELPGQTGRLAHRTYSLYAGNVSRYGGSSGQGRGMTRSRQVPGAVVERQR